MKQEQIIRQIVKKQINKLFEADMGLPGEMQDTMGYFDNYNREKAEYLKSRVEKASAEAQAASKKIVGTNFKDYSDRNAIAQRANKKGWEDEKKDFDKFSNNLQLTKDYLLQLQQTNDELQQAEEDSGTEAFPGIQPPAPPV